MAAVRLRGDNRKVDMPREVVPKVVRVRAAKVKAVGLKGDDRRVGVLSSNVRINRGGRRVGIDPVVDHPREVGRRDLRRRTSPSPRSPSRRLQLPRG